ncbi:DNA primase [Candidatus Microgenomates bacterium]|nr:DNA primase [Candidatus Microgenomates bacterium]
MDQLEEIKSKIDIVEFLNNYLSLKKAGRNFKANCPFHSEKTASFIISPERQIWHCFGACNDGGDIFKFLMKWENLEFPEALKILAQRAGVALKEYPVGEALQKKEKIFAVNHMASEFYHYLLLNHPAGKKALDYLRQRGIKDKSIELFRIGYAPNLWEGLSKYLVGKKGYKINDLEQAGLIVRSGPRTYDRFRGRLMFTLKNHRGQVVGFAGRILEDLKEAPLRPAQGGASQGQAKYINTPETSVYIKGEILYGMDLAADAIKKENLAILVEGELDAIQAFQAGTSNIVAIKGSALTEGQITLLKRFTENIALALDQDLAGEAAARRGIEMADQAGLNIRVIQIKEGKDPDECLRKNPAAWFAALKNARSFYDFLFQSSLDRHSGETPEDKKKIGEELLPTLAKISNEIVKAHYLKKLAQELEISEEGVRAAINKLEKKEKGKGEERKIISRSTRDEILEEYLLSLLLQSKNPQELLKDIGDKITCENPGKCFLHPALQKIFKSLIEYLNNLGSNEFVIDRFTRSQPKELTDLIDRLYLTDLGEFTAGETMEKEFKKAALELKSLALRRRLKQLTAMIKEESDEGKVESLSRQFQQISTELRKN